MSAASSHLEQLPRSLQVVLEQGHQVDWFDKVIAGAMVDHCHKTNPRIATPEDYRELLSASM